MRRLAIAVGAVGAVLLAGCGSPTPAGAPTSTSTTVARSWPAADGAREYETWATVLETADKQPTLCLGGIMDSLPPQCGGPSITNWDWDAVPPPSRRSGVRWAEYHVRGTYADGRFTLTETPEPGRPGESWWPDPDGDTPTTPCPEPEGGWVATDPAKTDDEHALIAAAKAQPDFGGIWLDDLQPPSDDGYQDLSKVVFTVTFTGDLDRHRAELQAVWGGPLCVWRAELPKAELDAAVARIESDLQGGRLGDLEVTSWGADEVRGRVHVEMSWAPDGAADQLSGRYGVPVKVTPALRPVG